MDARQGFAARKAPFVMHKRKAPRRRERRMLFAHKRMRGAGDRPPGSVRRSEKRRSP